MKYIIMCGGKYTEFETPRHLIKVNGEELVDEEAIKDELPNDEDNLIDEEDRKKDKLKVIRNKGIEQMKEKFSYVLEPQL